MANTFTQINIHTVFTVSGKENLLLNNFRSNLFRYIAGTLNDLGQYSLGVNGYTDYSRSQRDNVIKYIMNQEIHHQKKSFKEEYLNLLSKFEIEYDPKYLFEFIDF